jgi:chromosome segregation ATPase
MTSKEESEDPSLQKKCSICDKGFHFRKKIICNKCENAFCSNHCCKEIATIEGQKTICDSCYHEFRRTKLQEKFSHEIEGLNLELGRVRQACKRVERDYFDKTSEINLFESENEKISKKLNHSIQKLEKETNDLRVKLESSEKIELALLEDLFKTGEELKQANSDYLDSDSALEELKNNTLHVGNVKCDLTEQLMDLRRKVEHCLDYEKVTSELCPRCKETMKKCYQERITTDDRCPEESSMSLYTSQSILDSVREMKDSLNIIVVEPEKPPKCISF